MRGVLVSVTVAAAILLVLDFPLRLLELDQCLSTAGSPPAAAQSLSAAMPYSQLLSAVLLVLLPPEGPARVFKLLALSTAYNSFLASRFLGIGIKYVLWDSKCSYHENTPNSVSGHFHYYVFALSVRAYLIDLSKSYLSVAPSIAIHKKLSWIAIPALDALLCLITLKDTFFFFHSPRQCLYGIIFAALTYWFWKTFFADRWTDFFYQNQATGGFFLFSPPRLEFDSRRLGLWEVLIASQASSLMFAVGVGVPGEVLLPTLAETLITWFVQALASLLLLNYGRRIKLWPREILAHFLCIERYPSV